MFKAEEKQSRVSYRRVSKAVINSVEPKNYYTGSSRKQQEREDGPSKDYFAVSTPLTEFMNGMECTTPKKQGRLPQLHFLPKEVK